MSGIMRRLTGRAAVLTGLLILITGLATGTATAASGGGQVSNYTDSGIASPFGITAGPDGEQDLWFTNQDNSNGGSIGEMNTSGVLIGTYTGNGIDDPAGITAWNGELWFTNYANGTGGSIGEMNTSGVLLHTYTGNGIDGPDGITVGPDGALWFTNVGNNSIGQITITSGNVMISNYTGTGIDHPISITAGPDGRLWFTNNQNNTIGAITTPNPTTGTVTISNYAGYPPSDTYGSGIAGPVGITAGPHGDLWYANSDGGPYGTGSVGEMDTSGNVVTVIYDPSMVNPAGITAGPDGALWFTNNGNGVGTTIGRLDPVSLAVSSSSGPGIAGPQGITAGPDGALWFTNYGANGNGNSIGRITPPAVQTITFTSSPPSPAVYGGSYTPTATGGGSGNPVTFRIDPASTAGACSINSSGVVSFTGVGTCVIDANQAGLAMSYAAAAQVQQSFTIGQAPQTVTFTSTPPASPAFGSTYTVSATGGGSGNPVKFSISSSGSPLCVVSGSTVTFIGAGGCVIIAYQAGNADYLEGEAGQVIAVPQEAPVLTWARPASIAYGAPLGSAQLDATANVPGTFTYSPPAGTVLGVGTSTLTATFTPANTTNYTSGGTVSTQITVVPLPPPPHCFPPHCPD